eukprot:1819628-Rhodomonas_salina.1
MGAVCPSDPRHGHALDAPPVRQHARVVRACSESNGFVVAESEVYVHLRPHIERSRRLLSQLSERVVAPARNCIAAAVQNDDGTAMLLA